MTRAGADGCIMGAMVTPFEATLSALFAVGPVYAEDAHDARKLAQYYELAYVISELKPPPGSQLGPKEWRAVVIAIGYAETKFSLRVLDGDCKKHECDHGRARGYGQLHNNAFLARDWERLQGLEHIREQVLATDKMLKVAYRTCRATPTTAWPLPLFTFFAGRGCDDSKTIEPWSGAHDRFILWLKAWKAMG